MTREFQEAIQPQECNQAGACSLGDFAMMRGNNLAQFDRQNNTKLEDAGVLPKFDLKLANGDDEPIELKNPFKEELTTKQMKDAGVKATRKLEDDETHTVTVETKNGVKVSVGEGHDVTAPSGRKVHIEGTTVIEPNGQLHPKDKSGDVWVDKNGKEMIHRNKDGSVTIDSGDGGFYRADSNGVKKISAIRSRDGKTFEEIDTDTPLGGLRPSDMSKR